MAQVQKAGNQAARTAPPQRASRPNPRANQRPAQARQTEAPRPQRTNQTAGRKIDVFA